MSVIAASDSDIDCLHDVILELGEDGLEIVMILLNRDDRKYFVNQPGRNTGLSPLEVALEAGHFMIAWELINVVDVDLNRTRNGSMPPLHLAIE